MQPCLGGDPEGKVTLEEQVRAAVEAGYRSLDVALPALDRFLASYPSVVLVSLLQQHALYVGMVSGLPPLASGDVPAAAGGRGGTGAGEALLLRQARLMALCADLDALGGGTVLLPLSLPPPAGETQLLALERALRGLADVAAPFEARLAVTPRLGEGDAVGALAGVAALVARAGRSNLGLGLDLAGGQVPDEIPPPFVERLWAVRLGAAVWAEGRSSRLRALCAQLAGAGYRGAYSVAPVPSAPTLAAGARQAKEALEVYDCSQVP